MMTKVCNQCGGNFSVEEEDKAFYRQCDLPLPALCPPCRVQRRLAWRNERHLYKRVCQLSGKSTISFYETTSPYVVYAQESWWSDQWDASKYGREYDFNRSFFEQFGDLLRAVPHMAILISHGENSDYCPYAVRHKNCYLCVSGFGSEDSYYSYYLNNCRDCCDCSLLFQSELCYECMYSRNLYHAIFCWDCEDSSDLAFCDECIGCNHCIGCVGLRHKEYYIFNQKCSKEGFEDLFREIKTSYRSLRLFLSKYLEFRLSFPHRANRITNCENSRGDFLFNSKNLRSCFVCSDLEDSAYSWDIARGISHVYDSHYSPASELVYNCLSAVQSYKSICCVSCWDASEVSYSFQCFYSKNLLGCVGLKNKQYCIFNKQYSAEEYTQLSAKIVATMKKEGSWGEFFPMSLAPFPYADTIANEYFPREEKLPSNDHLQGQNHAEVEFARNEEVLDKVLTCQLTGKQYRIIAQELRFYQKLNLPIPLFAPETRYQERKKLERNKKLFTRKCEQCKKVIETTFSPEQNETVWCEQCYNKYLYSSGKGDSYEWH